MADCRVVCPTMELDPDLVLTRIKCSAFHGSLGADPIGSTGSYDAFLCVEVPLPWAHDISGNEPFHTLGKKMHAADGRSWRAQGLVPADHGDGRVRVIAFEQPAPPEDSPEQGWRSPFQRREWLVDDDRVLDLCRALLGADPLSIASHDDRAVDVDPSVVDLLVCTHGTRDTCCGGPGTAMHQELAGRLEIPTGSGGVRLLRCSHTGGHRFAPTALTLPDGYGWAHLTAELTERLVKRAGTPADFAPHCRGTSLFDSGPAQAADRAALVEFGWDWLDATRRAVVIAHERDTRATTVRIDGRLGSIGSSTPDRVAIEVRVEIDRFIPQPTCGVIEGPEFGVEPVWRTTDVRRVEPAQDLRG